MNDTDLTFLEEYKKLDKLCSDMLGTENGVSEYINEMQSTALSVSDGVPTWKNDLKTLKHLRWLRNGLAHDTDPQSPTQDDFDILESFHERILNAQDPLSMSGRLMARYKNEQKFKISNRRKKNNAKEKSTDSDTSESYASSKMYYLLFAAMAIVLVITFLYLLLK